MRLSFFSLILLALMSACSSAAKAPNSGPPPKAVVLISLDQFRWDYFEQFQPYFGSGGFRRFTETGSVLSNVRYRHAATMTCPGHAAIATGASGNINGIVGNDWYDVDRQAKVYCAEDPSVSLLGAPGSGRSPQYLMSETVGDVLKKAHPAAKVLTVSGKDRSAIMLGGHRADAAYWLQDSLITTSTYYLDKLPAWVRSFNARQLPKSMHGAVWNRVLPVTAYDTMQGPDDYWHEEDRQVLGRTFPHTITGGSDGYDWNYYEALRKSPFEDEILLAFVKEMVLEEGIGDDETTDFLGIGFSTVDRIGHPYGPDSHEIMDNVVRTDSVLSELFAFLDEQIGLDNLVVVLTADHGVQRFPELVADPEKGIWAGRVASSTVVEDVNRLLTDAFGPPAGADGWIDVYFNPHVYLRRATLSEKNITVSAAARVITDRLPALPQYDAAIAEPELAQAGSPESYSTYSGRSGDVLIRLADHHINRSSEFGTTHGTPWEGDVHVPMLWFGHGVAHVDNSDPWNVVDLAPTLLSLMGIERAATMDGRVISPVVRGNSP